MSIDVIDAHGAIQTVPTLPNAPFPVAQVNPTVLVAGQAIILVTGTAVQLPPHAITDQLVLKAAAGNNAAAMSVGPVGVNNTRDGTGTGFILAPGETILWNVNNSNLVYVNGTAGDIVSFTGS